ncbi:ankyrin repeat domain-containing protein [Phenylobacterium sp.]|uniref:ankyrin repeat domain-containing protein n=1 Tax=Phenylobacterium sp. TaxID=1871053 RepID=UPI00374C92FC
MSALRTLIDAIAEGDAARCADLLAAEPGLALASVEGGATRDDASANYLVSIEHYVYAGDTALHIAAAAYQPEIAARLIALGADVRAKNRRAAQPLHYAADGHPASPGWNPQAQAATIARLMEGGADPNAESQGSVTPLHRAVRTRCAAAVAALLAGGAEAGRKTASGSTPLVLATRQTGRGGSGSPEAKAQQAEIVRLLES